MLSAAVSLAHGFPWGCALPTPQEPPRPPLRHTGWLPQAWTKQLVRKAESGAPNWLSQENLRLLISGSRKCRLPGRAQACGARIWVLTSSAGVTSAPLHLRCPALHTLLSPKSKVFGVPPHHPRPAKLVPFLVDIQECVLFHPSIPSCRNACSPETSAQEQACAPAPGWCASVRPSWRLFALPPSPSWLLFRRSVTPCAPGLEGTVSPTTW